MEMAGRGFSGSYRFGYQGSEKDNEVSGDGNSYTTEFRGLDVRLGRWFSTDPEFNGEISPYTSMDNDPINANDVTGQWPDWGQMLDHAVNGMLDAAAIVAPGPIGAAIDMIHAGYYMSRGNMTMAKTQLLIAAAGIIVGHVAAKFVVRVAVATWRAGQKVIQKTIQTVIKPVANAVKSAYTATKAGVQKAFSKGVEAFKKTVKKMGGEGGLAKKEGTQAAKDAEKAVEKTADEAKTPTQIKTDKEKAVVKENTEKVGSETPPVEEKNVSKEGLSRAEQSSILQNKEGLWPKVSKNEYKAAADLTDQQTANLTKEQVDKLQSQGFTYGQLKEWKKTYEEQVKLATDKGWKDGRELIPAARLRSVNKILELWNAK